MHKSTHGFDFWDNYKDIITEMYVNKKYTTNQISKEFQCDPTTILRQLKRWNVPIREIRHNAIYD